MGDTMVSPMPRVESHEGVQRCQPVLDWWQEEHVMRAFAIAVGLSCVQAAVSAPIEWKVTDGGNGHFYEGVLDAQISWTEANDAATASGGHLVTITSALENQWVFENILNDGDLWLSDFGPWMGAFQMPGTPEPDGGWQWVTGEAFGYTNWRIDEPNNSGGFEEDFAHFIGIDQQPGPFWNDQIDQPSVQGNNLRGYVVEYVPAPGAPIILATMGLNSLRRRR